MKEAPIRVLICDDHPLFREGLRALAGAAEGLAVVGEAADGDEAVRLAAELCPDVVVMDLFMPGSGGIESTRRIVAADPRVAVLVLTMFEDEDSVFAAMRVGARGYLLKGSGHDEIARAIAAVAAGDAIFGPGVAERLVSFLASVPSGSARAFPELTERERQVLDLLARGDSNQLIAQRLHLSQKTVRNHVSNIFHKLQVVDRTQAVLRARDAGLGGARERAPGP